MTKMKLSNFPIMLAILFALSILSIAPLSTPAWCADSAAIARVLASPAAADVGTSTKCAFCGMKLYVKSDTPAAEYAGSLFFFGEKGGRVGSPAHREIPGKRAEKKARAFFFPSGMEEKNG